jgi:DNA adenine methylase
MTRPFLKWAGGKRQLLPELRRSVPRTFGRYYEPFVGGGALFFDLCPCRATLSDTNQELIHTYLAIRDEPENVINYLELLGENTRESFYTVRSMDVRLLPYAHKAARMIYLNKTCFNGLYRVNKRGLFNTPFGQYKNPLILDRHTLMEASRALSKATIKCQDAFQIDPHPGDLVYFDPPYYPRDNQSFTSYTSQGFTEEQHVQLANFAKQLLEKGVCIILSNSDTPFTRRIYKGLRVEVVKARRSINRDATKRGVITELLVTS